MEQLKLLDEAFRDSKERHAHELSLANGCVARECRGVSGYPTTWGYIMLRPYYLLSCYYVVLTRIKLYQLQ